MEARNRRLPDWLRRIRTRQVVLPRFQRLEAWGHNEVADLLSTVVRGLPAGSTLVLEVAGEPPFPWRSITGAPSEGDPITEQLLDGQQRLTALWRSLNDDYPDRKYFVVLPDEDGPGKELTIDPKARWTKNGKIYPLWADQPDKTWKRRHVPVRILRPDGEAESEAWDWALAAAEGDKDRQVEIMREVTRLRKRFDSFNLPFLSLPADTERSVALDVFIRINTRTVTLSTFDIVVAMVEDAAKQPLHEMVKTLAGSSPHLSAYDDIQDVALSAAAMLQDRRPTRGGWLGMDFEQMVSDWSRIARGARRTVRFFEQERVFDSRRLPTVAVLAPLVALWSQVGDGPDEKGNAYILLRSYLWRSFFTDRYESAASTSAFQDYRALRARLTGDDPQAAVPCFNEEEYALPDVEMLAQAGWPRRRDRLARAILLLSLRGGALDLADGAEVSRDHLGQREYHHLFPVAHLDDVLENGEGEADRALNCALITWKTNRTISSKEPLTYLRERAEASTLGETVIRRRLASHGIDFESLASGTYEEFLGNRAKMMKAGAKALCAGEDWTPFPSG